MDQQHTIFANDALQSAQSLTSESYTPAEISAKFGTISYSKGTPTEFLETVKKTQNHFLLFLIFITINPFCSYCFDIKNFFILNSKCIYSFLNSHYHHNN